MIRVVVVDDEALVRDGLTMIAGSHPQIEVVGVADSGVTAADVVARVVPNVVLMDIRMPETDGIQATRRILANHPAVKVLVLTTVESDEIVYDALRAGASGFLLKSSPREQLWNGILTVAAGNPLLAPSVMRRMIERELTARSAKASTRPLDLTDRQVELVLLVARGLSNGEIGAALHLAESTVKGYVSDILAKLNLRDRTQLAVLAFESGLVERGTEQSTGLPIGRNDSHH
jgi:DNA-binding NarL/FixJ family response regulator